MQRLLYAEDARNGAAMARVRIGLTVLWLASALILGHAGHADWQAQAPWIAAYLAIGLLMTLPRFRRHEPFRVWSICWLDAPMIFAARLAAIRAGAGLPGAALTFALYLGVLVATPSTYRRGPTIALAIEAFAFDAVLAWKTGGGVAWIVLAAVLSIMGVVMARRAGWRLREIADDWAAEKSRRDLLGRYFAPAVAERIFAMGEALARGERRVVTILFVDVRGFTALGEALAPEPLLDLLNEILAALAGRVFAHDGTLDKFTGDGLMAYFGAPLDQPDHAARAIECALEMLETIAAIDARHRATLGSEIRIGVGLHTGEVMVGNIGPADRREYTVIGDAVNTAARIEQLNKELGTSVLASQSTREAAGDRFAWTSRGAVPVRGKAEPVATWIPAPLGAARAVSRG